METTLIFNGNIEFVNSIVELLKENGFSEINESEMSVTKIENEMDIDIDIDAESFMEFDPNIWLPIGLALIGSGGISGALIAYFKSHQTEFKVKMDDSGNIAEVFAKNISLEKLPNIIKEIKGIIEQNRKKKER